MKLPTIKDLMREDAEFLRYEDGKLWYQIIWLGERIDPDFGTPYTGSYLFDFPIPVDDAGGGAFGPAEKAITLMRWIRKHLEFLRAAIGETTTMSPPSELPKRMTEIVLEGDLVERRESDRTNCGANGCDLPPEHPGKHRADCGCLNGCKAWECPNL